MSLGTPTDGLLDDAFNACSADVRHRARNFWFGLRLLPADRFEALCAIYAWMRHADDLADGDEGLDPSDRRRRIELYRGRTRAMFENETISEPDSGEHYIFRAMREVLHRHELDRRDFELVIEGQLADLEPCRLSSRDELLTYCDQVASTVGRICVSVWGASDPESLRLATERGSAFQLTNILRDIREDLARGRVYLPSDELEAAGLDIETLVSWRAPERCEAFILDQTERARAHYEASLGLEERLDESCRPTSWAMTEIYRSLLEKIGRRPVSISMDQRISLSSMRKFAIAYRARRRMRKASGAPGLQR
tara:strand:+ start:1181 stop:2110 length:930 start_codon:yes stop_codon:yes gene_type:complete